MLSIIISFIVPAMWIIPTPFPWRNKYRIWTAGILDSQFVCTKLLFRLTSVPNLLARSHLGPRFLHLGLMVYALCIIYSMLKRNMVSCRTFFSFRSRIERDHVLKYARLVDIFHLAAGKLDWTYAPFGSAPAEIRAYYYIAMKWMPSFLWINYKCTAMAIIWLRKTILKVFLAGLAIDWSIF